MDVGLLRMLTLEVQRSVKRMAGATVMIAVALAVATAKAQAPEAISPLAPPDTSSPRATLRSFIDSANDIYAQLGNRETTFARQRAIQRQIAFLLSCLDLSQLAPTIAASQGRESAVALKEVLDRIALPDENEIPDAEDVQTHQLTRWRIPGTEITLVKTSEGNRAGEFLFSADTVERAKGFYEVVRNLPYKSDAGSKGLYEEYCLRSGWMIPSGLVRALPSWAHASFRDHTIWQWGASALLIGLAVAGIVGLYRVIGRVTADCESYSARRRMLRLIVPLAVIGITSFVDFFLTYQIRLTGDVIIAMKLALRACSFVAGIIAVLQALNWVSELVIRTRRLRPEGIDSQLVRLGFRVLTFMVVTWLVIAAANYMGIPVTPLMAGLGASGLAVALASQHTVENLIAGIVLFADKPVRIGDVCQFGGIRGSVEEIGLRSTRIRGLDRTVVSIPNAEFAKLQLINYTRRDQILLQTTLRLRGDTTPGQLHNVLTKLREMLAQHPRTVKESARVRFVGYGDYSLDLEVFAFIKTRDWNEFLAAQEDILLRIMEVVNGVGSGFAIPVQMQFTENAPASSAGPNGAGVATETWGEKGVRSEKGFLGADAA